ncbi:MAG: tRNA(Ile)-lysidine synthase [Salibacteraceae bacterium]|jgi:tRNA(Ile)-lysidine synthase
MAKSLETIVLENSYLNKNATLLVGVSGGADSVVLAHILHTLGFSIAIAHCHFNLRGEDADEDQKFTKEWARSLNVPFFTTKFETQIYADTRKVSIQMAARDLRYFWFEKLGKENNFGQIAVGTHLTDNMETFLFNAVKGTGLSGLRGIKPQNGRVVRPLLNVGKEAIYQYAKAKGLSWKEDVSNQSIKYHRNKIRHQVLPVLAEINPNLEATFQRNFEKLSRVDAFVVSQMKAVWESWLIQEDKGLKISIEDIKRYAFSDVVLNYQLKEFGFNSVHVKNLLQAINGQPGAMVSSVDHHIYVDREFVFIQQKRFFTANQDFKVTEFLGEITNPLPLKFQDHHAAGLEITPSPKTVFLDFDKLIFPLNLRLWKEGDRFTPFGMKGKKKVSDLLIDLKIPKHEKQSVWVLESNGEICWVVGLRSSNNFKMDTNTERVYSIKLTN